MVTPKKVLTVVEGLILAVLGSHRVLHAQDEILRSVEIKAVASTSPDQPAEAANSDQPTLPILKNSNFGRTRRDAAVQFQSAAVARSAGMAG